MTKHFIKSVRSFHATIYIAGDYDYAVNRLQSYMEKGMCVSCRKTDYVYTYGKEAGIEVTLINYPKHEMTNDEWIAEARAIGTFLLDELAQGSFTIEFPDYTEFYSRRSADITPDVE